MQARLDIRRDRDTEPETSLFLHGRGLELLALHLDGRLLAGNEYQVTDEGLTLFDPPDAFELTVRTRIQPEANTALSGLYKSSAMYCTQCEPEGFRKITYYQDRPDVLSRFTTRISADAEKFPILLANGNLIADRRDGDRRTVTWEDPFPKPSYLFALVAGDLACLEDSFHTCSGREVTLRIYSEAHNIGQCDYAMGALKRAMRWDEEAFGREYDLDIYMIVAVEDFNFGAMENKGLNIFNTTCVLASPDTAVDAAYQRVEGVIGHEYFHNWSGNRVTCRDWFQLSLKEGFTVFRDSEFSSDMQSRTVKRIEDASFMRSVQFAEDAGPLAHPVRPDSYMEINNFYTSTVYEKGAEVVAMTRQLLGPTGFRQGSDLYFDRHDGAAVTTDDFVVAMEDANDADLGQFRRWYSQAGTPRLQVARDWQAGALTLDITQACPPTPGQSSKLPLHMPVVLGLLAEDGRDLVAPELVVESDAPFEVRDASLVLQLREACHRLRLAGLPTEPRVSFLRGFSAPVRVDFPRDADELAFLARHDSDGFARWDARQTLLLQQLNDQQSGTAVSSRIIDLFRGLIADACAATTPATQALLREMLALPSEPYLFEQYETIDVHAITGARDALGAALSEALADDWAALYAATAADAPYQPDPTGMARRGLSNLALGYLAGADSGEAEQRLAKHLRQADNLTDRLSALAWIADNAAFPDRQAILDRFYADWRQESLVVNQWLSVLASARPTTVSVLEKLLRHPGFDPRNPNKLRSLIGGFSQRNARNFHAPDGAGYQLLASQLIDLDARNPQMAARLATPLTRWQRYVPALGEVMRSVLKDLAGQPKLSRDLYEVVTKGLVPASENGW